MSKYAFLYVALVSTVRALVGISILETDFQPISEHSMHTSTMSSLNITPAKQKQKANVYVRPSSHSSE